MFESPTRSSGKVVFSARAASEASLQRKAEAAMGKRLGRSFMTIVRPVSALREMLEADAYEAFRVSPKTKRIVTFLREKQKTKLSLPIEVDGAKILCVKGTEVYTAYVPSPKGAAFMVLIEKTFGVEVTTRTWATRLFEEEGVRGQSGAVLVVQRTSSDLRLNPHVHAVFLDGVYHVAGGEEPKLHALPKLSTEDVTEVLEDAARRVARYLRRRDPFTASS